LLVHDGEINQIIGILHVRKAMALLTQEDELTTEHFRALLTTPYFIPAETDLFTQLQYFQENHERLGVIVDEYGELQGLVTLDDIIEEMVGEFTTSLNGLLLEILQDIPEASVSVKIGDCVIEIVQVQNQSIKTVKLFRAK
jgi:Mg2+/Co2+ transporter CorB